VKFQWERLGALLADGVEEILIQNFEEIEIDRDKIPLAPDWPHYLELERLGSYRVISARVGGVLVGYNAFFINRHSRHKNSIFAVNDEIYMLPEHRKGWSGVAFIRESEKMLRDAGVAKIEYGSTTHVKIGASRRTVGDLMVALGYEHTRSIYTKVV
jgi:GNAT superfamily N-acetyltransferase